MPEDWARGKGRRRRRGTGKKASKGNMKTHSLTPGMMGVTPADWQVSIPAAVAPARSDSCDNNNNERILSIYAMSVACRTVRVENENGKKRGRGGKNDLPHKCLGYRSPSQRSPAENYKGKRCRSGHIRWTIVDMVVVIMMEWKEKVIIEGRIVRSVSGPVFWLSWRDNPEERKKKKLQKRLTAAWTDN